MAASQTDTGSCPSMPQPCTATGMPSGVCRQCCYLLRRSATWATWSCDDFRVLAAWTNNLLVPTHARHSYPASGCGAVASFMERSGTRATTVDSAVLPYGPPRLLRCGARGLAVPLARQPHLTLPVDSDSDAAARPMPSPPLSPPRSTGTLALYRVPSRLATNVPASESDVHQWRRRSESFLCGLERGRLVGSLET